VLLSEVSLQVAKGERLAVVGPTGSGKSVLLRALAILDQSDVEEILFEGQSALDDVLRYRSQVMYLQQRPTLIEGTVEDNLRFPFELHIHHGRPFDRAWHHRQLEEFGRGESFFEKSSDNLSGGERQLVALLRALQLEPAALLLDEPTAALDDAATRGLETVLLDWMNEHRALLWVSHDPAQAERVATRVLQIQSGQIDTRQSAEGA